MWPCVGVLGVDMCWCVRCGHVLGVLGVDMCWVCRVWTCVGVLGLGFMEMSWCVDFIMSGQGWQIGCRG